MRDFCGGYHRHGVLQLLKYDNWRKDKQPAEAMEISKTGYTRQQTHSYVVVCDTAKGSNVPKLHIRSTQLGDNLIHTVTFLCHLRESFPGLRPGKDSLTSPGPSLGEDVNQTWNEMLIGFFSIVEDPRP
jgi:hypothetical protein